jgi:putative transposase
MSDKYAAIAAHGDCYPVRLMCEVLDVSVSGFYDAKARKSAPPTAHAIVDERLRVQVRAAHAASHRRYGAPRVERELRANGISTATKRVARLMREDQLVARAPTRVVHTTDSAHAEPIAPNLLARCFALADHPVPDRAWVGDMTYVPTRAGWMYLAVLLDLATRRIVGWATGATLETTLPLEALHHAIQMRQPEPGLIHHTDRGSQLECNRSSQQSVFI